MYRFIEMKFDFENSVDPFLDEINKKIRKKEHLTKNQILQCSKYMYELNWILKHEVKRFILRTVNSYLRKLKDIHDKEMKFYKIKNGESIL